MDQAALTAAMADYLDELGPEPDSAAREAWERDHPDSAVRSPRVCRWAQPNHVL